MSEPGELAASGAERAELAPAPLGDARAEADLLRRLGPRLLELLARRRERPLDAPVTTRRSPEELYARWNAPLAADGASEDELVRDLEEVLAESIDLGHPRTIGHQVAPPLAAAVLGDLVVSGLNNSQAVWEMSPVGTVLERRVLGWFAERVGWSLDGEGGDNAAGGSFLSGGSVGNFTALAAARARAFPEAWKRGMASAGPAAVVAGSTAHYCVERALGLLGLGLDALVSVPHRALRLDPERARAALVEARAAGRTVVALVGCAGSTATGSVDDLAGLARVAEEQGVWFHVDAAHAGAFLLSERLRPLLDGLGRASSFCLDLHKMGFQPSSSAIVLVRRAQDLEGAFRQDAPYLFHGQAWDSGSRTLQCTRRSDALRAWLALRMVGTRALAALQERTVATARRAWELVQSRAGFEVLHEPQTNILCFRHVPRALAGDAPALDRHNAALHARTNRSGRTFLTSTVLDGVRWLRITVMNPRTGASEIEFLLDELERAAREA